MVHVASLQRSCGDEAEVRWVDVMGCIGLFYPNFIVFFVFGHNDSLTISFLINRTLRAGGEVRNLVIPLPPPSHRCFLRGVGVFHGVSEERRETQRSLQSSEEWEDIMAVSTPCRCLILSI
jgi:hypothetical protein